MLYQAELHPCIWWNTLDFSTAARPPRGASPRYANCGKTFSASISMDLMPFSWGTA